MFIISSEYTLLDKKNRVVELTYFVNNESLAKLRFDYKNDKTDFTGNLFAIIGWKDTKYDKEKLNNFIEGQKWLGEEILNTI